jgi:7-cyano-7-deazaguanine synthase
MNAKPIAVILASGGLDSCVAAAWAARDYELAFFHADYGQRTLTRERAACRAQAAHFQVHHLWEVDLGFLGRLGGSSLTDPTLPIPQGAREATGLPNTYVPFRNALLLAAATAWAEVIRAAALVIGANILDNPGYPDCRPEFFQAFERVLELGTGPDTRLKILTPLLYLDKAGIIRLGLELGAPLHLTWSCYQENLLACGRCSSCRLRLQGFAAAGVADPVRYVPGGRHAWREEEGRGEGA